MDYAKYFKATDLSGESKHDNALAATKLFCVFKAQHPLLFFPIAGVEIYLLQSFLSVYHTLRRLKRFRVTFRHWTRSNVRRTYSMMQLVAKGLVWGSTLVKFGRQVDVAEGENMLFVSHPDPMPYLIPDVRPETYGLSFICTTCSMDFVR